MPGPSTGIKVAAEVKEAWESFKIEKKDASVKYEYIILAIENKVVVVEDTPEAGSSALIAELQGDVIPPDYKGLYNKMIPQKCRYAFAKLKWSEDDKGSILYKDGIAFLTYCDDDASPMLKMKYSGTKDAVKQACPGWTCEHTANTPDELSYQEVLSKISKGKALELKKL